MDGIKMLKGRRSIRKYKNVKVSRDIMKEIIDITRFTPSWANYQVARYTIIDDETKIKQLADSGVNGFVYNINTLKNAKGVLVLSFVKGKSGKLDLSKNEYATEESNVWEIFDAGIACQTFCLAAYEKGIGTCIMGVINSKNIAEIAKIPSNESVAALIVYGYPDEDVAETPRKSVDELLRFVD